MSVSIFERIIDELVSAAKKANHSVQRNEVIHALAALAIAQGAAEQVFAGEMSTPQQCLNFDSTGELLAVEENVRHMLRYFVHIYSSTMKQTAHLEHQLRGLSDLADDA